MKTLIVLFLSIITLKAQPPLIINVITIHPGNGVMIAEFNVQGTVTLTIYQLQSSTNLTDWSQCNDPFLGNGADKFLFTTFDNSIPTMFWRIKCLGEL